MVLYQNASKLDWKHKNAPNKNLNRVSQLKRNTFQWFIVLRLEGKYLYIWYGVVE